MLMGVYGCLIEFIGFRASVGVYGILGVCGCLWVFMGFTGVCGFLWVFMGFRVSVSEYGYFWVS